MGVFLALLALCGVTVGIWWYLRHKKKLAGRVGVQVVYMDLGMPDEYAKFTKDYTFLWTLRAKPKEGMRVVVPGNVEDSWGMVVALSTPEQLEKWSKEQLASVIRVATPKELKAAQRTAPRSRQRVRESDGLVGVQVVYMDLGMPDEYAESRKAYTFLWTLPAPPEENMRVVVPGDEGESWGMVVALSTPEQLEKWSKEQLASVIRVATPQELEAAAVKRRKIEAEKNSWLDEARRAAGLPVKGRRRKIPEGYPAIAPVSGTATSLAKAQTFGSMWWRAYKAARNDEEETRFNQIAQFWYAQRDALAEEVRIS
ncbi:MAG: hypothetical protein LBC29_03190 [Propionibacteriaceae bacterium]|nr:hypothetical protein [Propionibacteriaceae bacterium]